MSRLQVLVDGVTAYDGEVDPIVLPTRPELYPQSVRPQPGQQPPPLAKLMMLTALIEVIRQAIESPMLEPATVDITTRGMGRATLDIDMHVADGTLTQDR